MQDTKQPSDPDTSEAASSGGVADGQTALGEGVLTGNGGGWRCAIG